MPRERWGYRDSGMSWKDTQTKGALGQLSVPLGDGASVAELHTHGGRACEPGGVDVAWSPRPRMSHVENQSPVTGDRCVSPSKSARVTSFSCPMTACPSCLAPHLGGSSHPFTVTPTVGVCGGPRSGQVPSGPSLLRAHEIMVLNLMKSMRFLQQWTPHVLL